jgi:hypothetical protein
VTHHPDFDLTRHRIDCLCRSCRNYWAAMSDGLKLHHGGGSPSAPENAPVEQEEVLSLSGACSPVATASSRTRRAALASGRP